MSDSLVRALQYTNIPVPRKPRLAPWVTTVDLGDDRLQFRGAELAFTLRQPALIEAFGRIRTLLDGQHTVDGIAEAGSGALSPAAVTFLLQMLCANGLIQEGEVPLGFAGDDPARLEHAVRFFSHFDANPFAALTTLREARVTVIGQGELAKAVISALESLGVGHLATDEAGEDADFIVACAESAAFGFFDEVNASALVRGARWLHVALHGITARLGPTVIPRQSGCYTCYYRRVRSLVPDLDAFDAYRTQSVANAGPPGEGSLSAFRALVAGQAALEATRILTGFASPTTIGRFHVLSPLTPSVASHPVPRLPRCPSCGVTSRHPEVWHEETIAAGLAGSSRSADDA